MNATPCPRNLPQHFNGCACTPNRSVTPEADVEALTGLGFTSQSDEDAWDSYRATGIVPDGYEVDPDTEGELVRIEGPFDADGEYTGDYDPPEECKAIGQHLSRVDDDGYCVFCGDGSNDEDEEDEDEPGAKVIAPEPPFSQVANDEHRQRAIEYADRYSGARPDSFDFEPDWSKENHRPTNARGLAPGDRLLSNQVITSVTQRHGVVYVHTGGADPTDKADHIFSHGDPVIVHKDRVDLSDPDHFEVEVRREIADRVSYAEDMTNDETYVMPADERAAMALAIRTRMARATQPGNISPIVNMNPDAADGRAKVGDNVIFSTPMHGDSAYEVLGKMAAVDIQGHDGTQVVWGETGGVEYVLKDLRTGKQTTSDLRQHMWRRIPAPGDNGPAAQAMTEARA